MFVDRFDHRFAPSGSGRTVRASGKTRGGHGEFLSGEKMAKRRQINRWKFRAPSCSARRGLGLQAARDSLDVIARQGDESTQLNK
jgi:hypothetical protein